MPLSKDSVTVTAVFSRELKERLKKFAQSKHWTMSQTVVLLVEEGLNQAEDLDSNGDSSSDGSLKS